MKKLVIDRQKWLRGEGSKNSRLLRPNDQKMCCLGFFSLACGYTEEEIENIETPSDLYDKLEKDLYPKNLLTTVVKANSNITEALMLLNDDLKLLESERERRLKIAFSDLGIEVEFVN